LHDTSSRDAAEGDVGEHTVGEFCPHLKPELQEGERGVFGAAAEEAHHDHNKGLTAVNESSGGTSAFTYTETLT
jgi:hypothetical protein